MQPPNIDLDFGCIGGFWLHFGLGWLHIGLGFCCTRGLRTVQLACGLAAELNGYSAKMVKVRQEPPGQRGAQCLMHAWWLSEHVKTSVGQSFRWWPLSFHSSTCTLCSLQPLLQVPTRLGKSLTITRKAGALCVPGVFVATGKGRV